MFFFPPFIVVFLFAVFFPLWVSTPHCSSLANYQQCRLFLLFLFLAASLSQPGLSRYPWIFIFNCFLLFCLSAHHCLCLFQPPPVGKSLSLFSVLTNHCPWNHFFFFNLVYDKVWIVCQGAHWRFYLKIKLWKTKLFDILFLLPLRHKKENRWISSVIIGGSQHLRWRGDI